MSRPLLTFLLSLHLSLSFLFFSPSQRRVSVGEMLLGQARSLFLDEISTGLDGATTLDIVRSIKSWCRASNGSATISLLQANPDVIALFDQIILMREGCIVFSGTRFELDQHLFTMRITPNPDVDLADWYALLHGIERG